jgi:hypothetical protein
MYFNFVKKVNLKLKWKTKELQGVKICSLQQQSFVFIETYIPRVF